MRGQNILFGAEVPTKPNLISSVCPPFGAKTCASSFCTLGGGAAGSKSKQMSKGT